MGGFKSAELIAKLAFVKSNRAATGGSANSEAINTLNYQVTVLSDALNEAIGAIVDLTAEVEALSSSSHTHTNSAVINELAEDATHKLTYKGELVNG